MKIAIVNRHVDDVLGGSEMQCDNIGRGLSAKGHEVIYVAPAGSKEKNYSRPYQIVAVDSNAKAIADAVINANPDIVYWRFNKYFLYKSAKAIASHNIPIVFSISHISDTQRWNYLVNPFKSPLNFIKAIKQSLENAFNYRGYQYVSGVASLNTQFLNLLPIKKQRYLPNSVDTASTPFTWPRPYVVWVSNLKPQKQPELYIKIAKEFAASGVDFLMVGKVLSEDYAWVKTEHERTPHFHFLGPKTPAEVNGILANCLLNIHTCKPEGFGNIFIQAWLKHKPTVSFAFDPGGFIDANNLGGFADGDYDVFKSQIARLINDPQYRATTGERAYEFGRANFSIEKTVNEIEDFLTEVLEDSKKGFEKELVSQS